MRLFDLETSRVNQADPNTSSSDCRTAYPIQRLTIQQPATADIESTPLAFRKAVVPASRNSGRSGGGPFPGGSGTAIPRTPKEALASLRRRFCPPPSSSSSHPLSATNPVPTTSPRSAKNIRSKTVWKVQMVEPGWHRY